MHCILKSTSATPGLTAVRKSEQKKWRHPCSNPCPGKAGYLSARLRGASPLEAAKNGSLLASTVIRHRGAIIPRNAMQAALYWQE